MSAELFIYWHVEPAAGASALAQALAFQHALRAEHSGLEARLYRRDDPARRRITVMETYAADGGLPASLQAAVLAPAWCPGTRHLEVFEAVG